MSDKILMRCEYCGGLLTNAEGNIWICESCGTSSVVKATAESGNFSESSVIKGFTMTVECRGKVNEYRVRNKAEFQIAFNCRATMADPFPIEVSLTVDGRPRGTFEHLPKSGKGSVVFELDGESVFAYATGKASMVTDEAELSEDEDAEGCYNIAGLNVTIVRTGEMEK